MAAWPTNKKDFSIKDIPKEFKQVYRILKEEFQTTDKKTGEINMNIKTLYTNIQDMQKELGHLAKVYLEKEELAGKNSDLRNSIDKKNTNLDKLREDAAEKDKQISDQKDQIAKITSEGISNKDDTQRAQQKLKVLIINQEDLKEEIASFEQKLFGNPSGKVGDGLFNAFIILDALIEQKHFNSTNGAKSEEIFDYKSEQELARLFSQYLCKSFNNGSIDKNEVNKLVGFFNSKCDHYEILAMEDNPGLTNKFHHSLTSQEPAARVNKYHTLTIKPKNLESASAVLVKAIVEAK